MTQFRKHYTCPCGTSWWDEHDCLCNDRCPTCDAEIEPDDYEEVDAELNGETRFRRHVWFAVNPVMSARNLRHARPLPTWPPLSYRSAPMSMGLMRQQFLPDDPPRLDYHIQHRRGKSGSLADLVGLHQRRHLRRPLRTSRRTASKRPMGVKLWAGYSRSAKQARLPGGEALEEFLDGLSQEQNGPRRQGPFAPLFHPSRQSAIRPVCVHCYHQHSIHRRDG